MLEANSSSRIGAAAALTIVSVLLILDVAVPDYAAGRRHRPSIVKRTLANCSGIAMFTPADVHHGRTDRLLEARAGVLAGAYAAHPERFVKGPPRARPIPTEVWINRPEKAVPRA